ncbi:alcohol dehydrogenase catalytic domain-containing protein [Sphingomonas sp. Root710]|uniref:alcohol dehydrogenase catalytic domain-containing protein n=1 Tax=Sphingomonas sp. Root710 TaxID=1736594 RepID=UPI001F2FDC6B|nr:NADH oxidase [Sphingomonas sp. Root710]
MIDASGNLTLSLKQVIVPDPDDDEVIVRVEATPINPSDLGLLLGPADVSSLKEDSAGSRLTFTIPPGRLGPVAGRLGQSLAAGGEGAGTVVAAGKNAAEFVGKTVAMLAGGMYSDYRLIRAENVVVVPDGATAAQSASMFVNPQTSLGFVETARLEGHKAIIHAPAASNLGRMLQRICLADDIPLINIVRSQAQVEIMRSLGATRILNSNDDDFVARLTDEIAAVEATVAFDAIGGGSLGSTILHAMERAAIRNMKVYDRYGSDTFKQLYIYGNLDQSETIINRAGLGYNWGACGWLLPPFLQKIGEDGADRLRKRIVDELTTTFSSHYTRTITLSEALQPEILRAYARRAAGEKFLVNPALG